jgi:eukaryotic-like serine/threonine-protein kinase
MQLYQTRPESPESGRFDFPNGDMLAISKSGELAILLDETPAGGTLARAPMTGGIARRVLEGVQYAGADWSPDGRELAIVREVEGESRLEYPIGKPLLKSRQDFFASPRFSPDGERIAFFESLSQPSVGVIDTRGSAKKILSGGWASLSGAPCWTPNGKEIWVTGATAPGQPEALWAVSLSGKRRLVTRVPGVLELDDISRQGRVLMAHHTMLRTLRGRANDGGSERDLSWLDWSNPSDLSNDGKLLLLTERGEGSGATPAVYLRGTDGSPALRIGEGFGLALSPDGKWVLALRRVRGEPATLVLLPTGPGETKTLKNEGLQEYGGGAWLPDGKRIIFSAKTAGGRDRLYLQDVAGGAPRPIGSDGLTIRRFASPLSPDGKSVVGLRGAETVVIRLDGGEPRPVAGIAAGEIPTQWSADGRSLYVYGWVSGGQIMKVSMVDLESGQRTFFTEIKLEGGVRARWLRITPDGKSYAYAGNRGLSELYLVDGLR